MGTRHLYWILTGPSFAEYPCTIKPRKDDRDDQLEIHLVWIDRRKCTVMYGVAKDLACQQGSYSYSYCQGSEGNNTGDCFMQSSSMVFTLSEYQCYSIVSVTITLPSFPSLDCIFYRIFLFVVLSQHLMSPYLVFYCITCWSFFVNLSYSFLACEGHAIPTFIQYVVCTVPRVSTMMVQYCWVSNVVSLPASWRH